MADWRDVPWGVGRGYRARSLSVVAGPALAGRLPPWLRIGVVIVAGAPLFGLLRFAPGLAVAAVLLGLATFAWGPYYVFARTLMQRLVPEDVRSQAADAHMTITSLGFPLGSAVGGAVTGGIGVPAVILAIACSYLALGCCRCSRRHCATVEFTGSDRVTGEAWADRGRSGSTST